jgi:hypothetical protein
MLVTKLVASAWLISAAHSCEMNPDIAVAGRSGRG